MNFDLLTMVILLRPLNLVLCAISVFVGAFVTGTIQPISNVALACISATLIMAAGNAINDVYDLEIDRINKPFRPLPSGRISTDLAFKFAIILFAFGVFLSIFISWIAFWTAIAVSLGLFFYSYRLKRTVLVGNLCISLCSALAFFYGSLAVGRWQEALIPATFAFLFHLGREIIKDIEDKDADRVQAATTLPVKYGTKTALGIASVVLSVLIVATLFPYIFDIYGTAYITVVVLGVDVVILGILFFMWAFPFPEFLRRISFILKADMFVGLLAVYLGVQGKTIL